MGRNTYARRRLILGGPVRTVYDDCLPTAADGVDKRENLCTIEGWTNMSQDERYDAVPRALNRIWRLRSAEECFRLRQKYNRVGRAHFYWRLPRRTMTASRAAPSTSRSAPTGDQRGASPGQPASMAAEDRGSEESLNPLMCRVWPDGTLLVAGWKADEEVEEMDVGWDEARGEVYCCADCMDCKESVREDGVLVDAHGVPKKSTDELWREWAVVWYAEWVERYGKEFEWPTYDQRDDGADDDNDNDYGSSSNNSDDRSNDDNNDHSSDGSCSEGGSLDSGDGSGYISDGSEGGSEGGACGNKQAEDEDGNDGRDEIAVGVKRGGESEGRDSKRRRLG
ncbi:unnamed protein product [Peniophora sp. CBMAI 1063]|nr:unnamed protein product [Peniophora sp. CBMAI 1063]